jgi:hypothetical protein
MRDMQGALYFPFIGVPNTAWWTRTMLYWDDVATIVPREYIRNPELHQPYTLELIRAGLLYQVFPDNAGRHLERNFGEYLHRLSAREIDRRRRDFSMGNVSAVHSDKWLTYMSGLREIHELGLAATDSLSASGSCISIESATAAEFMAALALSLCEEASGGRWHSSDRNPSETWVPTTDTPPAIRALLAGLKPVSDDFSDGNMLQMRVRGELQVAQVRTHLMERLLPVPETPVPLRKIVKFRKKYGDLLPTFRRYLESKIDEALMISDPTFRFRFLNRIEDEMGQRCEEAKAYLSELGLKRVAQSSLLRVLKFVPGLKDTIETAQDLAENMRTSQALEAEPLAYLAFAHATFAPTQDYRVDPMTGIPLIAAMHEHPGEL